MELAAGCCFRGGVLHRVHLLNENINLSAVSAHTSEEINRLQHLLAEKIDRNVPIQNSQNLFAVDGRC
jgi:hypothetical protein